MRGLSAAVALLTISVSIPLSFHGAPIANPLPDGVKVVPDAIEANGTYSHTSPIPGATAVHFKNPGGISFEGVVHFVHATSGNHPFAAMFVGDNGAAHWVPTFLDGFDNTFSGEGSGVAYLGALGSKVISPSVIPTGTATNVSSIALLGNYADTGGWLILLWSQAEGSVHWQFTLASGTTTGDEVNGSRIETFAIYDLDAAVSVGVAPAGKATIDGSKTINADAGNQLVGLIRYSIGDAFGRGTLTLDADAQHLRVQMDRTTIPSGSGNCLGITRDVVLVNSHAPFRIGLNYLGEGRTQIFGVIAEFPANGPGPFEMSPFPDTTGPSC